MRWLSQIRFHVRSLLSKRKLDEQLSEEVRTHVEMATEANVVNGMTPEEARDAALREFGNLPSVQERAREERGWLWLEQSGQDLRYALRQITRNRGFTAAVVLVLALGIGACTSIFTVIDALLYRPLPVRDPAGLRSIGFRSREGDRVYPNITSPNVRDFQTGIGGLEDFIASATVSATVRAGNQAVTPAIGQMVTANYFEALAVRPVLGRGFRAEEDRSGGPDAVAVISYDCWQTLFERAPDAVGRTFQVNKQLLTVIGVAPPGFQGLEGIRAPLFWAPSALDRSLDVYAVYRLTGRLKADATEAQVRAQIDLVMAEVAGKYARQGAPGYEHYGSVPTGLRSLLVPAGFGRLGALGSGEGRAPVKPMAALLGGAVGLVLLVACSNAASLLLVRALARRREIAVRLTLGATKGRLLRQLLVESVLLSLGAAVLGLALAHWGTAGLVALRPASLSFIAVDAHVDGRALLFAIGTAVVTGLVFGLLPARQALQFDVHATLKQETPVASGLHRRLAVRQWLLLIQMAVGTVLLVGAGLCLRSVVELIRVNPGFEIKNVLTVVASVDRDKYSEPAAHALVASMAGRIAAIPGVHQVALANHMSPLSGNVAWTGVDRLEGYAPKPGERIQFGWVGVGPGYFRLLGIPVMLGREFNASDAPGAPRATLVNEAFVRRYWPGQNPLGKSLRDGVVVGVIADTRSVQLSEAAAPTVYTAMAQAELAGFTLLIKTERNPSALAPTVRGALGALDESLWPPRIETMEQTWAESMAPQRALLFLLVVFSLLAVGLAAVGLYGFVACSVAQRTREIGIRLAIGADRGDILALVLRQSLGLVVQGLAAGLCLALLAARLLQGFLYGVGPADPLALTGVAGLLLIVAAFATWLPARRAAKVDPVVALRAE